MKWALQQIPEFMKLVTSRSIVGDRSIMHKRHEYTMYIAIEYIQRQLNRKKQVRTGDTYKFFIAPGEDREAILDFCRFYILSCNGKWYRNDEKTVYTLDPIDPDIVAKTAGPYCDYRKVLDETLCLGISDESRVPITSVLNIGNCKSMETIRFSSYDRYKRKNENLTLDLEINTLSIPNSKDLMPNITVKCVSVR